MTVRQADHLLSLVGSRIAKVGDTPKLSGYAVSSCRSDPGVSPVSERSTRERWL
jgi:hypothetical protein